MPDVTRSRVRMPRVSRRRFLVGSMGAAAGLAGAGVFRPGRATAAGLSLDPPSGGARTVDHTFFRFFDIPMPRDVWEARMEVGYGNVRRFTYPVVHEWVDIAGPDVVPNVKAVNDVYAPGRWKARARGLTDLNLDTVGGVNSPAADPQKRGFLPRNLMGGLEGGVTGGLLRFKSHQQYINRTRADELKYPQMFGYHGWEEETNATIVMDRAAAKKVLGITDAQFDGIVAWWAANKAAVEQAWWYWLLDEGGDVHVGGIGRLDVRYAFDTPLQMWLCDLDLAYDVINDRVTLAWDWVSMAGDMLFSRWLSEALGIRTLTGWECNSLSDMNVDIRMDASSADLDLNTAVDYLIYRVGNSWAFESAMGDVPNLAAEYLNESPYQSEALAFADKTYGNGSQYNYTPATWNLQDGETILLDWRNVRKRDGFTMSPNYIEPKPNAFPGQIEENGSTLLFSGPMDMTQWSKGTYAGRWAALSDPSNPDGLPPWGAPYVTFSIQASQAMAKWFVAGNVPPKLPKSDPNTDVPPFPQPVFGPTPPLPPGRTVKVDLYSFLDVPMVKSRWRQYEENEYQQIVSLEAPVSVRTSDYFPPDPQSIVPFADKASGLRFRVTGRNLPEINLDTIGGEANPAGFVPRDLMGGLEGGVTGGTATLRSRMRYGARTREALYRMPQYWGYYGWENFWDGELTMDRSAAKKILGITEAQFDGFAAWFAANREDLRSAWRQWYYREFRRATPMAWFNYPIQIWAFLLELVSADASEIKLKFSVLNEALDVTMGRWFMQTFMPFMEASWDDLYLNMTIGAATSDVDLDGVTDWGLWGYGGNKNPKWWWEPFIGDNAYLANEYRMAGSPAAPYAGTAITEVPTNWNLASGEQLNFHHAGLTLISVTPDATDFPANVAIQPGRVSITGPLDLETWSQGEFPTEWAALGGVAPFGLPQFAVQE